MTPDSCLKSAVCEGPRVASLARKPPQWSRRRRFEAEPCAPGGLSLEACLTQQYSTSAAAGVRSVRELSLLIRRIHW
eukprot:5568056-Amphidinium_carterae.1